MNAAGTEVPQAPQDTISSLTFGTVQNVPILIAGSWNKSVSVWTITPQGIAPAAVTEHDAPVLSVQFDDATGLVVSAGCDNTVRAWDVNTNQSVVIGQHASAIKDCRVVPAHNVIATGGWDNAVRFWDVRSQTKQPVMEIPLPGKVYSMDASGNILVTAMDKQMFGVLDIRSPGAFAQQGTSPHEFQTRVVAAMNNDAGYAIGSIEGRVHLQYYGELAAHSFPFRCHRTVDNTKAPPCTYINPVTSLSFHPITGALATTGGDDIALWNHYGKVSIKTITPKEGPISTGKFSPDGSMYAYACSYDWSLGANGPGRQKRHRIFIRAVKEEDVAITAPAAK